MRAAIYTRISSDPKGQGLGVARQEADCRTYCERLGWTVVEVYADNDVSATKRRPRPDYDRMIDAIKADEVDAIVSWSYDRLCRRILDLEQILDLAEDKDLSLGCVAGDLNIATPMGRTLARIITSIAAGEVETLRARITRKQLELADAGKVGNGGRRPYGYTSTRTEVVEAEAAVVREIAARVLAGESLGGIAAGLNGRGVAPARAEEWTRTGVRAVVIKPHVTGLRVYQGQIHGEGTWPPILERDVWEAVVGVLRNPSRKTSPAGGNARRHLLSGIARCGRCDATVNVASGEAGARYKCTGCGRISRSQRYVDDFVIGFVLGRLEDLPRAEETPSGAGVSTEAAALVQRRRQLIDECALLGLTAEELRRALVRIDTRLGELEAERERAQSPYLLESVRGITRAEWDLLPLARQRAIVDRVASVTLLPNGSMGRGFDPTSVRLLSRPAA